MPPKLACPPPPPSPDPRFFVLAAPRECGTYSTPVRRGSTGSQISARPSRGSAFPAFRLSRLSGYIRLYPTIEKPKSPAMNSALRPRPFAICHLPPLVRGPSSVVSGLTRAAHNLVHLVIDNPGRGIYSRVMPTDNEPSYGWPRSPVGASPVEDF